MTTYNYSQKALELFKLRPNIDPQTVVDRLWDKGYTNIDATVTGEGDCGCDCCVTAYRPEDKDNYVSAVLSKEDRHELEAWAWAAADHLVPGFELDDGGEVEIYLTRTNKDIALTARGLVFKQVEEVRLDYTED